MSSKILAGVMSLGIFLTGAGVYAYSMLTPPSDTSEPTSVQTTNSEEDDAAPSCCPLSGRSCCH